MREVVIVSGARTAIGDYMGSLSTLTPIQLGVTALNGALKKAGLVMHKNALFRHPISVAYLA